MTSTRWPILAAILLLAPLASGCLGGSDETADDAAPTSADPEARTDQTRAETNRTRLSFPLEEPIDRTVWANGSFQPHQAGNGPGSATGEDEHRIAVDDLSSQTPVRLRAELSFDREQPIADPFDLSWTAGDASVYALEETDQGTEDAIEALFLPGEGEVAVVVEYQSPTGTAPPDDYTLRIQVEARPDVLPPGVPTAVRTDATRGLGIASTGDGSVDALVYGSDDAVAFSGASDSGSLEIDAGLADASQAPVLVLRPGSDPATVEANGTGGELVALPLAFERGEPRPVTGDQPVEWSFEVDGVPLAVGLYLQVADSGAGLAFTGGRGEGAVSGPSGELVSGELGCGTCIAGTLGQRLVTVPGHPGLGAGAYEASYQPDGSVGTEVGHLVVSYER